jgi:hypothetical protein
MHGASRFLKVSSNVYGLRRPVSEQGDTQVTSSFAGGASGVVVVSPLGNGARRTPTPIGQ